MDIFDLLPIAALIDVDVASMRGGLSTLLFESRTLKLFERQQEILENRLIADVTLSDPDETTKQWRMNARVRAWILGRDRTQRFFWLNPIPLNTRNNLDRLGRCARLSTFAQTDRRIALRTCWHIEMLASGLFRRFETAKATNNSPHPSVSLCSDYPLPCSEIWSDPLIASVIMRNRSGAGLGESK
jgi:hypothetical protein